MNPVDVIDEYSPEIIEALVREYQALLSLEHWKIDVEVHTDIDEVGLKHLENEAWVDFNDGYDEATVHVNAFAIKPGGVEEAVAHEVSHIALRELDRIAHFAVPRRMRKHVAQAVDRSVTYFSRAMARMRAKK